MQEHTFSSFDEQLKELEREIADMGRLAYQQTADAFNALLTGDLEQAHAIIEGDVAIDQKQHLIEQKAVLVISKNQPMSIDLREVIAALRVSNDLERIGDLAKNIAKRTITISELPRQPDLITGINQLSQLVLVQLQDVLVAYEKRDEETAMDIRQKDRDIDALYTTVFRDLLTYMLENTQNIKICTHLLFCAKNVERIGDHTTNLAETIHFILTGEILDDNRPKADESSESG